MPATGIKTARLSVARGVGVAHVINGMEPVHLVMMGTGEVSVRNNVARGV